MSPTEYDYDRECREIDEKMKNKATRNEKVKWIFQRGGDIIGTFDKRFEAIEYLKTMLKQTINDLEGQDKLSSEFDYNIDYERIQIYQIIIRPAYLGL